MTNPVTIVDCRILRFGSVIVVRALSGTVLILCHVFQIHKSPLGKTQISKSLRKVYGTTVKNKQCYKNRILSCGMYHLNGSIPLVVKKSINKCGWQSEGVQAL